jgi:DNA recombination protein RmuC
MDCHAADRGFLRTQDVEERQRIKSSVERAVLAKAREVQKYIDAQLTTSFAVSVVPDAAYEVCGAALAQALSLHVVVVPYAMFIPYVLLVFHTILKTSQTIDLEALERAIQETETSLGSIRAELEGRHARGLTMIQNARDEISAQAGRASSRLSSIRVQRGMTPNRPLEGEMTLPLLDSKPALSAASNVAG